MPRIKVDPNKGLFQEGASTGAEPAAGSLSGQLEAIKSMPKSVNGASAATLLATQVRLSHADSGKIILIGSEGGIYKLPSTKPGWRARFFITGALHNSCVISGTLGTEIFLTGALVDRGGTPSGAVTALTVPFTNALNSQLTIANGAATVVAPAVIDVTEIAEGIYFTEGTFGA